VNEFFKSVGEGVKDRLARLNFWQLLLLVVVVIFSVAAAHYVFR
jgi:hypothetical protein